MVPDPHPPQATILIVDDELQILDLLKATLELHDFSCLIAANGPRALEILSESPVDLVISDIRMPGMDGLQLLELVALQWPQVARMINTGYADKNNVLEALNRNHVHAFIEKPWNPQELVSIVRSTIQQSKDQDRALALSEERTRRVEAQKEQVERVFRAVTTTSREAILMMDDQSHITYWNRAAETMFGYPAEEAQRQNMIDLLAPVESHAALQKRLTQFREGQEDSEATGLFRFSARRKNGTTFPVELSSGILQSQGQWQSLAIVRDVTDRERASRNFRTLVNASIIGILVIDGDGHCLFANRSAQRLIGRTDQELNLFGFANFFGGEGAREIRVQVNGKPGVAEFSLVKVEWDGKLADLVMLYDVTERRETALKMEKMAFHDLLTGLPNRSLFYDRLRQAMVRADRINRQLAVLYIDLDRFKTVNDSLGHEVGDRLLQEIARRLQKNIRATDTAARFGGDEFLILLISSDKVQHVEPMVDRMIKALVEPFFIDGREIRVTVSVGASIYPIHGADSDALIRHADAALRQAKETGRNNLVIYEPGLEPRIAGMFEMESRLHKALEREEFLLHYQPQVDCRTGRIVGVEALLRWQDPDTGLVPPYEFIPLLEENGLINDVGEWVLRTACRQNKAWQDQGFTPVRMSVNLSGREFLSGEVPKRVEGALEASGLVPQWLDLEVTETIVMKDSGAAKVGLQELSDMGIQIALDDFGTGYSSLSYLHHFKFNRLKIDRSFVRGLPKDAHGQAICQAVVAMSSALGYIVVAEGVEESSQLAWLQEIGCDEIQGYFFSRPLPPDALESLLKANPHPPWVNIGSPEEKPTIDLNYS